MHSCMCMRQWLHVNKSVCVGRRCRCFPGITQMRIPEQLCVSMSSLCFGSAGTYTGMLPWLGVSGGIFRLRKLDFLCTYGSPDLIPLYISRDDTSNSVLIPNASKLPGAPAWPHGHSGNRVPSSVFLVYLSCCGQATVVAVVVGVKSPNC